MTAAARKLPPEPAVRPSPLAVFTARCEARAILFVAGEFDLHEAVDALQAAAVASGLVAELGQAAVQRLMATAFHAVRADLAVTNVTAGAAQSADSDDAAVTNVTAADDYAGLSSTFVALCRAADEKQRSKPPDIERARRLMADEVTLERAWHENNKPAGVAASTLEAAEFLLQQKDPQRLRTWLAKRSAEESEAIHLYFRNKEEGQ